MRNRNSSNLILFLLGVFSETQIQIVGSIGIAEVFIYVLAPFVFLFDYYHLKQHGFLPVIMLAIMSCIGCVMSSLHNGTPPQHIYRGLATAYSLFAIPVVMHHFLWRNLNGFKWLLLGHVVSSIITIFAFTSLAEKVVTSDTGDVSSGQLYYLTHFGPLFALPLNCFYLKVPIGLSALLFSLPPIYTMFNTATGRSALMAVVITLAMVLFVGKHIRKMRTLKRHLVTLFLVAIFAVTCFSIGYKFLAVNGYLTEEAHLKYEGQTKRGTGFASLIMSGRSDFFIGLFAVLDEPIYGHGPWPLDQKGYCDDFLANYGDAEDYQKKVEWDRTIVNTYGRVAQRTIPCHSMLIGNWLFYGILGLPFWIYILIKMVALLRKSIDVVPQWFGYFAIVIPQMGWGIFFSGYGARMTTCWFITAMLLAIAVGEGKILMPREMLLERDRHS